MSEIPFYDTVIIGGGPGGLTAGIYAMRAAMKTVLIEKTASGGQMNLSDSVENWPGEEHISGMDLSNKFLEHAKSYGLPIISGEVTAIDPSLSFHTVRLADGTAVNCHAVILATGGSPRQLGILGENKYYGNGVSYCAVCDGFFFTDRTVVVVGGGDSAVEESLYLAKLAKKVYLAHRRDELRAGRLLQQRLQKECKIEVLWNTVLTAIEADADGVCSIDMKDTKAGGASKLATDGVFIFIGFEPNNGLVPAGVKTSREGYVITNDKCESSIPGIFAIGDLREKAIRQIITAAADGCIASLSAAHFVETQKVGKDACELTVV